MNIKVCYENTNVDSDEYVVSVTDYTTIDYDQLLEGRENCNLYLKDNDTNIWIRIPSIKTLRLFLSAVIDEKTEVSFPN